MVPAAFYASYFPGFFEDRKWFSWFPGQSFFSFIETDETH
jgi:hypothetical protein